MERFLLILRAHADQSAATSPPSTNSTEPPGGE
jgi:hypothetical protein